MEQLVMGKRNRVRRIIVIIVGIAVILFFLLSVKRLLRWEAETKLLELNVSSVQSYVSGERIKTGIENTDITIIENKEIDQYFDGNAYTFVIDAKGNVVGAFGAEAKAYGEINKYYLMDYLNNQGNKDTKGYITKADLYQGETAILAIEWLYDAINTSTAVSGHTIDIMTHGFLVSLVPESYVNAEIQKIWNLAVLIVVTTIIALSLALVYNYYYRKTAGWRISKRRETDEITGLLHPLVHKDKVKELVRKKPKESTRILAYVSVTLENYNLLFELSGKKCCERILRDAANTIGRQLEEGELITRLKSDVFGMLLYYKDEEQLKKRLHEVGSLIDALLKIRSDYRVVSP